jgi:phosphoglycerate dehydrogenase-like enzyme
LNRREKFSTYAGESPRFMANPFRRGEFHTSYPLLELSNLIGSPHNSAMVPGITDEATKRAVGNMKRFPENKPVIGVVRWGNFV